MQDQKSPIADPANDPTAAVEELAEQAEKAVPGMSDQGDTLGRVIEKIRESENILVTLSRDPSVDEMAGALALTMFLDGLQKHTTAIYSGKTPDALKFLQPEGTFESNTASLQDFIIALSKEKADHLRYKLEGDFVKIYITPYKTTLSEADLEFSRGDYNVDLVLAIAVPTAGDLDEALTEYGRIMHDATTVDITCGEPGRFGEIEWSDPGASSVSEMLTRLIFRMEGEDVTLEKEVANALLTGIVAATGRFSNERTNSDTMQLAAKLMAMGADQQMIAMHVIDSEAEEKAAAQAEEEREKAAQAQAEADAAAREAAKAADTSGTTVAVDERALEQAKARATMEAAAAAAVNQAVATATENAAAVGASGVGVQAASAGAETGAGSRVGIVGGGVSGSETTGPSLPPVQMPVLGVQMGGQVAAQPQGLSQAEVQPQAQPQVTAQVQPAQINPENPVLPTVTTPTVATGVTAPTMTTPTVEPVPVVTPTVAPVTAPVAAPMAAPEPKNYEAMIEQALAEPLPVETAASAAGLLKTPVVTPKPAEAAQGVEMPQTAVGAQPVEVPKPMEMPQTAMGGAMPTAGMGVPAGINPAVMAAPQEAAEAAAPILGTMKMEPVEPVSAAAPVTTGIISTPTAGAGAGETGVPGVPGAAANNAAGMATMPEMPAGMAAPEMKPGQTILPPAPAPEVGMGLMPPTETGVPMSSGAVTPGVAPSVGVAGTPATSVTPGAPGVTAAPGTPGTLGAPGTVPNGAAGAGPSVAPGAFQIPGAA